LKDPSFKEAYWKVIITFKYIFIIISLKANNQISVPRLKDT